MGLSNPDRASATSIYTHVARLFIPSFYPSLSPRIACPVSSSFYPSLSPRIACPVSLSARTLHVFLSLVISTHACPVSFALHVLSPDDAVHVFSASHCMSCRLLSLVIPTHCMSCQLSFPLLASVQGFVERGGTSLASSSPATGSDALHRQPDLTPYMDAQRPLEHI
jgi:hypothetical protein